MPKNEHTSSNSAPSRIHELQILNKNNWNGIDNVILGIDEAGRGALAGPVTAAACALPDPELWAKNPVLGVADSKTINTESKRERIFNQIMQNTDITYGIGAASHDEIDDINILQATFLAMQRAVEDYKKRNPSKRVRYVLVDGNQIPPFIRESLEFGGETVIKGDLKCSNISAASIIAKVTRDRAMNKHDMDINDGEWKFVGHKGYGSKGHRDLLKEKGHGSPIHRKTFAPLRNILLERVSRK